MLATKQSKGDGLLALATAVDRSAALDCSAVPDSPVAPDSSVAPDGSPTPDGSACVADGSAHVFFPEQPVALPVSEGGRPHVGRMVVKRSGKRVPYSIHKLERHVTRLSKGLSSSVDATSVLRLSSDFESISTQDLSAEIALQAESLMTEHPDYGLLAGRVLMHDLEDERPRTFCAALELLKNNTRPGTSQVVSLVCPALLKVARANRAAIQEALLMENNFRFSVMAVRTLKHAYLQKAIVGGKARFAECPQYMYMRVALGLYGDNLPEAFAFYGQLSRGEISVGSPALASVGTTHPQMASCFLACMQRPYLDAEDVSQDSIGSFFATLNDMALVSKTSGGIGLHAHKVRAHNSYIAGTNGYSNGVVPLLRIFESMAQYVDQGGNRRPGAIAVYLEPWHADVRDFLQLRMPGGDESRRARTLNLGLWVPDEFMRRVKANKPWTLMDPAECPGLNEVYGAEFEALYARYEAEGRGRATLPAQALMQEIVQAQFASGQPYMLYKDSVNRKNQPNLGVIQQSNLCVAGNTYVTTQSGLMYIAELAAVSGEAVRNADGQDEQAAALKERIDETLTQVQAAVAEEASGRALVDAFTAACAAHAAARSVLEEAVATRGKANAVAETAASAEAHRTMFAARDAMEAAGPTPFRNRLHTLRVCLKALMVRPRHLRDLVPEDEDFRVDVWNNSGWAGVIPRCTGVDQPLLRITTSYGSRIDCTPDHEFVLADGQTRVRAADLAFGAALLAPRPAVYAGLPGQQWSYEASFRRGFVRGYYLRGFGDRPENQHGPELEKKVFVLSLCRDTTPTAVLDLLGYDELEARKKHTDDRWDHKHNAIVSLEGNDRFGGIPFNAPPCTRHAWALGFQAALGGTIGLARSYYAYLEKPWLLLRSLGHDCRIELVDNEGLCRLAYPAKCEPPEPVTYAKYRLRTAADPAPAADDLSAYVVDEPTAVMRSRGVDPPTVTGIERLGGKHKVYCFTEPETHVGCFNLQPTGQCTEIVEYTSPDEVAVCTLASLALPSCVSSQVKDGVHQLGFDFAKLHGLAQAAVRHLDRAIDANVYPLERARQSNLRHRPMGIGVQGLADVFCRLRLPFTSPQARELNRRIFETIYHGALTASNRLAEAHGTYATYDQSHTAQGKLQFDLWGVTPSGVFPWQPLREAIARHGLRNSLLVAPMPTATTSQILGNMESFEPFTSNMYQRRVRSGIFTMVNRHMVAHLEELGLWTDDIRHAIALNEGSLQDIPGIPPAVADIYKTVYEVKQRGRIDMAADAAAFIDQSMSLNLFLRHPSVDKAVAMHLYAWGKGLKTGCYYFRVPQDSGAAKITETGSSILSSLQAASPPQHSPDETDEAPVTSAKKVESLLCEIDGANECTSCSA